MAHKSFKAQNQFGWICFVPEKHCCNIIFGNIYADGIHDQFFSLHQQQTSADCLHRWDTLHIFVTFHSWCIGELCDSLFDNWFMYQELLTSINHHNAKKRKDNLTDMINLTRFWGRHKLLSLFSLLISCLFLLLPCSFIANITMLRELRPKLSLKECGKFFTAIL